MNKLKVFLGIVLLTTLCACSGKQDKYVIQGAVMDVGNCGGGQGFFSETYTCSTKVEVEKETEYWDVYGRVMKGQTVYKHCWREETNYLCFRTASKVINKRWRK